MTRLTREQIDRMKKGTLEGLRLGAVVRAWGKRDHLEPALLVPGGRCDACLHVHAVVWEKGHKRVCFGCASSAIRRAADAGENSAVHPLHVLLDDERFAEGGSASHE